MPEHVHAIEITGLTMAFGDQRVLHGVDLTVPNGTVCALLGPNGAGRTTIVNILSILLPPDEGTARVAGHDVATDGAPWARACPAASPARAGAPTTWPTSLRRLC